MDIPNINTKRDVCTDVFSMKAQLYVCLHQRVVMVEIQNPETLNRPLHLSAGPFSRMTPLNNKLYTLKGLTSRSFCRIIFEFSACTRTG